MACTGVEQFNLSLQTFEANNELGLEAHRLIWLVRIISTSIERKKLGWWKLLSFKTFTLSKETCLLEQTKKVGVVNYLESY